MNPGNHCFICGEEYGAGNSLVNESSFLRCIDDNHHVSYFRRDGEFLDLMFDWRGEFQVRTNYILRRTHIYFRTKQLPARTIAFMDYTDFDISSKDNFDNQIEKLLLLS